MCWKGNRNEKEIDKICLFVSGHPAMKPATCKMGKMSRTYRRRNSYEEYWYTQWYLELDVKKGKSVAGSTKIIVSGDKHLLKISGFKGISVLKPRDFLDNYLK